MAYQFNGTTQYLTLPYAPTGYPFTLFAVCRPNSFTGTPCAITFDNSGNAPTLAFVGYAATGACRAGIESSPSNGYVSSTNTTTTGAASSVAAVITSSQVIAYLNGSGKNATSHSVPFPSLNRTSVGSIRYSAAQGNFMNGVVAEVAAWEAALSDAEIASLAAGFTPDQIRPQSLQFYAPLVRDLQDLRGGRAITNNNGATVATHPRIIT